MGWAEVKKEADALCKKVKKERPDFLVIGDGSGSKMGYPIGFAAVTIDYRNKKVYRDFGACSDGTVNIAELLAYQVPFARIMRMHKANKDMPKTTVLVVTDSQYAASQGTDFNTDNLGINDIVLFSLGSVCSWGIEVEWVFQPRNTNVFSVWADKKSKEIREKCKA